MNLDKIADRSYSRVAQQVPDDSPLKGEDGKIMCPWCRRPMRVRFSSLGRIWTDEDDEPVLVDGVRFKCAGDGGCGYRPNFDIPITQSEYEEEFDLRDGKPNIDMGASADTSEEVKERLEALGYKV